MYLKHALYANPGYIDSQALVTLPMKCKHYI